MLCAVISWVGNAFVTADSEAALLDMALDPETVHVRGFRAFGLDRSIGNAISSTVVVLGGSPM